MTDIYIADFLSLILIFLRIIAAIYAAPAYSNTAFQSTAKTIFSLFVAYILFFVVEKPAALQNIDLYNFALLAVKEIITGLIIGFSLNLIFYGISYAGSFIGFDMGLMMAQALNPLDETNNNVIGQIIYFAALLVFFIINGHHYLFRGLALSFTIIPLGEYAINSNLVEMLTKLTSGIFIIAVKISAPFLVSYMLIHIGEGVTSRVIPQMQVFFVTQPVKVALGFMLLAFLIPIYVFVIKNMLEAYEDSLFMIIRSMGN